MLNEVLPEALFGFFMVFARVGAAVALLPGFGETYISIRIRLIIALAISAVALPVVSETIPALPASPWALMLVLVAEMAVGAFLGTMARLLISALQMAGMVIAYQSALANALSFDPTSAQQGALAGSFLTLLGLLLIFVTDLHHLMLRAIVESYTIFTPGAMPPLGDFSEAIVRIVGRSFVLALQIAAPFVLIGMLFSLGVGLLARLMPQVRIYFVAMPLQIALGFVVMMLAISGVMLWFLTNFGDVWTRFALPV